MARPAAFCFMSIRRTVPDTAFPEVVLALPPVASPPTNSALDFADPDSAPVTGAGREAVLWTFTLGAGARAGASSKRFRCDDSTSDGRSPEEEDDEDEDSEDEEVSAALTPPPPPPPPPVLLLRLLVTDDDDEEEGVAAATICKDPPGQRLRAARVDAAADGSMRTAGDWPTS